MTLRQLLRSDVVPVMVSVADEKEIRPRAVAAARSTHQSVARSGMRGNTARDRSGIRQHNHLAFRRGGRKRHGDSVGADINDAGACYRAAGRHIRPRREHVADSGRPGWTRRAVSTIGARRAVRTIRASCTCRPSRASRAIGSSRAGYSCNTRRSGNTGRASSAIGAGGTCRPGWSGYASRAGYSCNTRRSCNTTWSGNTSRPGYACYTGRSRSPRRASRPYRAQRNREDRRMAGRSAFLAIERNIDHAVVRCDEEAIIRTRRRHPALNRSRSVYIQIGTSRRYRNAARQPPRPPAHCCR